MCLFNHKPIAFKMPYKIHYEKMKEQVYRNLFNKQNPFFASNDTTQKHFLIFKQRIVYFLGKIKFC